MLTSIVLLCLVVVFPDAGAEFKISPLTITVDEVVDVITLDRLTIYNPEVSQTDDTPLVAGPKYKIDVNKLKTGELRWMGLSQDLLSITGRGTIPYGQLVRIDSGDPEIDGYWYVYDAMNKRYNKSGDLLFDKKIRKRGKWKNVKLSIINRKTYVLNDSKNTSIAN